MRERALLQDLMYLSDREGIKCSSGFTTEILLKPRTECEAAQKIPARKGHLTQSIHGLEK